MIACGPPLRFGLFDYLAASMAWDADSAPTSLAAVLGLTLDAVRPQLGDFEQRQYLGPRQMGETLGRLGVVYRVRNDRPVNWPAFGLARVQLEGPWPKTKARCRRTFWVGVDASMSARRPEIFDCMGLMAGGWLPFEVWAHGLIERRVKGNPGATGGWYLTHAYEVQGQWRSI